MGADCLEMLRRVRIVSADAVRIGELEYGGLRDYLIPWLGCEIYKNFFCCMKRVRLAAPIESLMSALSAANAGAGTWPKESFTAQPGWYLAFGRPAPADTRWLRLYWNVNPSGAISLTGIATDILNRLAIPFRLKVLLDTSIARRDAAVLYVPLAAWPAAAQDFMGPACTRLASSRNIEAGTPLFTKTLRPGVGLAEDPQTGLSFGMHRSGLVARSLAKSYLAGHSDEKQWPDLSAEFAREGLSIDRPYLNPGSAGVYEL